MKIDVKLPTRIATELLQLKLEQSERKFFEEAIEDVCEDVMDFLDELQDESPKLYEFIIGTLCLHYLELGITQPYDINKDLFDLLKDEDLSTIIDTLDNVHEEDKFIYYSELFFTTIDKNNHDNLGWYQIHNEVIKSGWGNIYSRFNPFFELEEAIYKFSFPNIETILLEEQFCEEYEYLKSVLDYPSQVIYILTDLINRKYTKEDSDMLVGIILKEYYRFVKGRSLSDDNFSEAKDKIVINKIENSKYLNTVVDEIKEDKKLLSHVVERYCFYQDNMFCEEQLNLHKIDEKTQYMKKFPKQKDQ